MKTENRAAGISRILSAGLLCLWMLPVFTAAAKADDQIEQIIVNKPDIVAYYRAEDGDGTVEASLGSEKLSVSGNDKFADTGEGISYLAMVDISASINSTRFANIKESLKTFKEQLREQDRLILYSFGDEVTVVLDGTEDAAAAGERIDALSNDNMNTVLFDAIDDAADFIHNSENEKAEKWVMIIFSDGVDYADNTKTAASSTERLMREGIPAYTVAVENNQSSYSEQDISEYQGNFSNVAKKTGGLAWTPGKSDTLSRSVMEALDNIQSSALGGYKASFRSKSNKVSNKEETFTLTFPDGTKDTRDVMVSRSQADNEGPTASVEAADDHTFRVTYSEPVEDGGDSLNYLVTRNGTVIGIDQVTADADTPNAYLLKTNSKLTNRTYHFKISNVTDTANEQNALTAGEFDVQVTNLEEPDLTPPEVEAVTQSNDQGFLVKFTEPVKNADNTGNYTVTHKKKNVAVSQVMPAEEENTYLLLIDDGLQNGTYQVKAGGSIEDFADEPNTMNEMEPAEVRVKGVKIRILDLLLRWWPIVLTVVVAILILLLLLFRRKLRKRNYTVIDGEIIEFGDVDEKIHIGVMAKNQGQKKANGKPVTIWVSNGQDKPKKLQYVIDGSCFVGRNSQLCDIYCDDPNMGRQHFNLSVQPDGGILLTDLNSLNGTSVNGKRIQGTRSLVSGDIVTAGNIRFKIEW